MSPGLGKTFICNLTCYNIIKPNVKRAQNQSTTLPGELLLSVNVQLCLHDWHSWEMTCGMKLKWYQWLQSKTVNSYTTIKHKTSSSIIAWKNQKGATSGLLMAKRTHSLFVLRPWYNKDTLANGRWWFFFLTFSFKQIELFSRPSFPDGLLPHASKMCQYLIISTRCQILTEATSP